MKRLLNILILIIVAVSCVKIDPFTETDDGGNVLGFYLDGNEISYITSGGLFTGKPLEHCVYAPYTIMLAIVLILDSRLMV